MKNKTNVIFTILIITFVSIVVSVQPGLADEVPKPTVSKYSTTQSKPATSPFTEIQLKKLANHWNDPKTKITIPPQYAISLGLTKGDEKIYGRWISGINGSRSRIHTFVRLDNGRGYFLSREGPMGENALEIHDYWVDLGFKIIAAISVSKANGIAVLPLHDAQIELQEEFNGWAVIADELPTRRYNSRGGQLYPSEKGDFENE